MEKKRHKINIHIYIYMQTYKHTNILDQNKIKENKKKIYKQKIKNEKKDKK